MKIKDVIQRVGERNIPVVNINDCTDDVIRAMVALPHSRLAYVVDDDERLVGTVTVGSVLRHIYPHHYGTAIHGHGVLRTLTAEKARGIMDCEDIHTNPEEDVEEVLERMAETGVKEMAVVDSQHRVVGDVTAVDLLCFCHLEEAEE